MICSLETKRYSRHIALGCDAHVATLMIPEHPKLMGMLDARRSDRR